MNKSGRGKVLAVVGAQYGSEGKGVVVKYLADKYNVHVRVGGPNAGHSFIHKGELYKMQVIPCGWTNPNAIVMIGRGALVNPILLRQEIEMVEKVDPTIRERLIIDMYAGVLDEKFAQEEGHIHGEIHHRIGSTGEGVGAARAARMSRNPENFRHMKDTTTEEGFRDMLGDTVSLLHTIICNGGNVLLEGAQGSALSMIHGPWPYVTSHDTNAAQMAADVGIPPHWVSEVLLVARTYPIRVAGNSGPLANELSWEYFSNKFHRKVEEKTTVTKKIRRIGEWDDELLQKALILNGAEEVAIMFIDYINPADEGKTRYEDLSDESKLFIMKIETKFGVKVKYIGTGGFEINGQFNLIERN